MIRFIQLSVISLWLIGLTACGLQAEENQPSPALVTNTSLSQTDKTTDKMPNTPDLTPLFSRIWRVSNTDTDSPLGSIYIFLPNGTLLETSCTEPYRIATWTIDPGNPNALKATEDGQLAFVATLDKLSNSTLQLHQNLILSNEKLDLTLTAVDQEFVCPDLPR